MTDSAEIARLKAEAAQAAAEAAAAKAAAAQAALDAAIASTPASAVEQAGEPRTTDAPGEPAAQAADAAPSAEPAAAAEQPQQPVQEPVQEPAPAQAETAAAAEHASGSQEAEEAGYTAQVRSGYSFSSPTLPVGTYLDTLSGGEPAAVKGLSVGIPLGLLNRHALVAGATGTGKTRTLQLLAEGLSAAGVPVFLADVKGDLSGLAEVGASNDKIASRIASTGQDWKGQSFPIELFNLGGSDSGAGISGTPIRTTVTEFGPILLSRVLGLNDTQASALQLVFHWADSQGLALLDLKDLRAVVDYLTNTDAGKEELKTIGGVSAATAGVILREIAALEAAGGDAFFGEPALDVRDLMRVSPDGRGIISALELADIQSQGTLFSTFLMWLLAELFETLPEVGDPDKPTMVFFFDEAHLLFSGASKAFLEAVVRTVRLIRSKGVGIVFITQSPTDVPDEVLAQLGSRVQHALRAHTPADPGRHRQPGAGLLTAETQVRHECGQRVRLRAAGPAGPGRRRGRRGRSRRRAGRQGAGQGRRRRAEGPGEGGRPPGGSASEGGRAPGARGRQGGPASPARGGEGCRAPQAGGREDHRLGGPPDHPRDHALHLRHPQAPLRTDSSKAKGLHQPSRIGAAPRACSWATAARP